MTALLAQPCSVGPSLKLPQYQRVILPDLIGRI